MIRFIFKYYISRNHMKQKLSRCIEGLIICRVNSGGLRHGGEISLSLTLENTTGQLNQRVSVCGCVKMIDWKTGT